MMRGLRSVRISRWLFRGGVFLLSLFILIPSVLPAGKVYRGDKGELDIQVGRVSTPPKIDGVLDDPAWQEAVQLTGFYETRPGENVPPPVRTVAYIAYDDENFYFAFKAYDPKPQAIRATMTDRDQIHDDDHVGIELDTFNDQRRAFRFLLNPFGIQADSIKSSGRGGHGGGPGGGRGGSTFDAIWHSAGRITEDGWEVEAAIPFKSLRFQNKPVQTWGINLVRKYPREKDRNFNYTRVDWHNECYLCQEATLGGLAGIKPSRNMEFTPYMTAIQNGALSDSEDYSSPFANEKVDSDAGIDFRYGLTPNLTLNFAFNPDFNQVEADVDRLDVNLRYAISFPEKRPFFLEGGDYFNTAIDAVYTRSIRDPKYGIKLTGKEGAHTIGFLSAYDEATSVILPDAESSENIFLGKGAYYNIFRYKGDIGENSYLGFLLTDKEFEEAYNRVVGFDGSFRLGQVHRLNFQALRSYTQELEATFLSEDLDGERYADNAIEVNFSRNTRRWSYNFSYNDYGEDFKADAGFMRRVDFRRFSFRTGYNFYPQDSMVVSWDPSFNFSRNYNQQGELTDEDIRASIDFDFKGQFSIDANFSKSFELYSDNPFSFQSFRISVRANPSKRFSFFSNFNIGEGIDYNTLRLARRTSLGGHFTLKPLSQLVFNFSTNRQDFNTREEGNEIFTAQTFRLRTVYQFTSRFFIRFIIQYRFVNRNLQEFPEEDEEDEVYPWEERFDSYFLVSYKINPQTVFFFGYNDLFFNPFEQFYHTGRTFFVKFSYNFRL